MASLITDSHTVNSRINENGRILIPASLRRQMGVGPGDSVIMEVVGGVLHVESYRARIRRIQEEFRQYAKPGVLASDELIAERRQESRREQEQGLA